jgi:hypothetical protein
MLRENAPQVASPVWDDGHETLALPAAFDRLALRYFKFPQKRWMRRQASSSTGVATA